jgi:Predicted esterase of the alpha-beta hydrolase superfamily
VESTGIILEGGAMRSMFSAGVLDFFLDRKIEIPNVLAVSAGAYAGMNYVSGQRGRVMDAVINPLEKEKYLGFGTFLKKGTFFDMDLLFDTIPNHLAPFDFQAFTESAKRFITSTVNCLTGEAVYFDEFADEDIFLKVCRAANSLPFIARIMEIGGVPMLDGGMAEAIPLGKALEEGWKKIVVVVTRNSGYRKKQRYFYLAMLRLIYHKYPRFVHMVRGRAAQYNQSLNLLKQLEEEGRAFVLRPAEHVHLTNNEADADRLREYYRHGYERAQEKEQELREFLVV